MSEIEISSESLSKLDTIAKLDEALSLASWSIEARGEIMRKRIEMAQAAKRDAERAFQKPAASGLLIKAPFGVSDIVHNHGHYKPIRTDADGSSVFSVTPGVLRDLIRSNNGKAWADLNQEALASDMMR
jgi:hypothetical protein